MVPLLTGMKHNEIPGTSAEDLAVDTDLMERLKEW